MTVCANQAVTGGAMFTTGRDSGTENELSALDMTVEHCLFFENLAYFLGGVIENWDFSPINLQLNAVDMIRNHAYFMSIGYSGMMDSVANDEGQQRTLVFNDVLIEGHGTYVGALSGILCLEPGGYVNAYLLEADGAFTNVSFTGLTIRDYVMAELPSTSAFSFAARPISLTVDGLAIENVRGYDASGINGVNGACAFALSSTFGHVDFVHVSIEHSGGSSENTLGTGTVWFVGNGYNTGVPGPSAFRFRDSTFVENNAALGGAVYLSDADADLSLLRCSFIQNVAYRSGGAIYFEAARAGQTFMVASSWFLDNAVRPAASSGGRNYALSIYTGMADTQALVKFGQL